MGYREVRRRLPTLHAAGAAPERLCGPGTLHASPQEQRIGETLQSSTLVALGRVPLFYYVTHLFAYAAMATS